uniref:GDSL esterase/lipase n=1 Tax=Kalanchoe fedtschenkoi TaxID=63787 RepID=A0A7N0T742_KALFE
MILVAPLMLTSHTVFMKTLDRYFMAAIAIHVMLSMHICFGEAFTSFIFGDSLVDVGNNNYLLTLSKADSPPYGIDFASSGGNPTGRFTNGRTITDIVDEALGAGSFSPPYLDPNAKQESAILRGLNYASGSSGILDETGIFFIGRISLSKQVSNFEETKFHMVNLMGQRKADELIRRAIFSITTGSNDILSHLQDSFLTSFMDHKLSPSTFQNFLISNMTMQLKRLQNLGAHKILVVGVGPLGCIPIVRALNFVPLGECADQVNAFVRSYNLNLRKMLEKLNQETYPQLPIVVFADPYAIVSRVIQSPHLYGFENAYDPCCVGHFLPFICLGGSQANATTYGLCQDRSKYVFWDAYHPTEAANIIIAKELLDGNHSVISPMNIRGLYNY